MVVKNLRVVCLYQSVKTFSGFCFLLFTFKVLMLTQPCSAHRLRTNTYLLPIWYDITCLYAVQVRFALAIMYSIWLDPQVNVVTLKGEVICI